MSLKGDAKHHKVSMKGQGMNKKVTVVVIITVPQFVKYLTSEGNGLIHDSGVQWPGSARHCTTITG
jgi:hypothetical protein